MILCIAFLHAMRSRHTADEARSEMFQILPVMNNVIKSNPPEHSFVKTFYGMFSDLDHLEEEHRVERKVLCAPATNIYETDTLYCIEVALPGYQRSDIRIRREEDLITVWAETHNTHHKKLQKFYRQEFLPGSFSRSFLLPDDAGAATASFAEGVLCIRMEKKSHEMTNAAIAYAINIQ